MIFVAVGTQKFSFNRLLQSVDELVAGGTIREPVFAQTGHSGYEPANYESAAFLSKEEFAQKISSCDLLITHSGVATIVAGLKEGKPVIVAPRLKKYGEHVDDHQVQIAESFSDQNYVIMCCDMEQLPDCVEQAKNHKFDRYVSQRQLMQETIAEFLNDYMKL